jgi:hypothetical protein
MKVVRSILSVVLGFAVMAGIIMYVTPIAARYYRAEDFRTINPAYMIANLAYSAAAAISGGFLTAWIAGYREMRHASVLGLAMIVMGFVSMRMQGQHQPGWYEVVIAGIGPIAAMLGAALRLLTKRKSVA